MLSGDNSILKNAQSAKRETDEATEYEKVKVAVAGGFDSNGNFKAEQVKEELDNLGVPYTETETDIIVELPSGKEIAISKSTGEISEMVPKIVYDYNGGEDTGEVPNDDTEYKEGEKVTIKFTPIAEREGFEFLGWSTSMTATEAEYKVDGTKTVTMEKRGIRLYAVWRGIPHTVSYYANNGTGDVPKDGNTHIKGEDVAISFDPLPTRTDYKFMGWSENKASKSAEYTAEGIGTMKMPAKDVKLYAIWLKSSNISYRVEEHLMTLDGRYIVQADHNYVYTDGRIDTIIPIADLKKDYEGYTLQKAQVDGKDVTNVSLSGDGAVIKLYYERNKYSISFDGNGVTSPETVYAYWGTGVRLPTLTREDFIFRDWSSDDGTYSNVYSVTMPKENLTLKAQWQLRVSVGQEVILSDENFFVLSLTDYEGNSDYVRLITKFPIVSANGSYVQKDCEWDEYATYWGYAPWANGLQDTGLDLRHDAYKYKANVPWKCHQYALMKGAVSGNLPLYDDITIMESTWQMQRIESRFLFR